MTKAALPCIALLIATSMLVVRQAPASGDAPVNQPASPQPTDIMAAPVETGTAGAGCVPVWVIDAEGIRRLPDRCPVTSVTRAEDASAAAPSPATVSAMDPDLCEPPWFVDSAGIRRVLHECLAAEPEPPSVERVSVPPSAPATGEGLDALSDCDPMYWVDARGIRRLRPECL